MNTIQLKPWDPADRQELAELYRQTDQSRCLVRVSVPLNEQATDRYLEGVRRREMDGHPFLAFAVLLEDTVIGKIDATLAEDRCAEMDIVLKEAYCSKGYGTEAVRLIIRLLAKKQWCRMITAYADSDNEAVCRMLQKCGFAKGRTFRVMSWSPAAEATACRKKKAGNTCA